MKPAHVRPRADRDIDEALAYLFMENPAAANSFLDALERDLDMLSRQPGIGSLRYTHILPVEGLRMRPVTGFPWLVFYFERSDHLDVIRLLHSRRDISSLLSDESSL